MIRRPNMLFIVDENYRLTRGSACQSKIMTNMTAIIMTFCFMESSSFPHLL